MLYGYSAAEVTPFLGVTTSCVITSLSSGKRMDNLISQYGNLLSNFGKNVPFSSPSFAEPI